ncbi:MAG: ATP synthase F1 subunit delta [Coriobacteriia bacterium]
MSDEKAMTYARALFELAQAAGAVDEADEGLQSIVKAVRTHAGLRDALGDASVPAEKKREIVREIFAGQASPEAVAVATVLAERGEIETLEAVGRLFREISERELGMVVAEVTTAVPLNDDMRKLLTDKLSSMLDRPVTLREQVDPSIVGGVVIKVAGRVLDGSVALQLDHAKATLASTLSGGES